VQVIALESLWRAVGCQMADDCSVTVCSGDLYTEAAEAATAAMKGRIASKYYMLADESWAQVTD